MLREKRREIIMNMVRSQQYVAVTELMDVLHVSNETVRRDLVSLKEQGLIHCVRGGAMHRAQTAIVDPTEVRRELNAVEKEEICRYAATLVDDGDSLAIGGATTTMTIGKYLAEKSQLTVITNSFDIGSDVKQNPSNTVILIGGELDAWERKTLGREAEDELRKLRVDKAFISAAGISAESGVTEYSEKENALSQTIIEIAQKTYLLNDYSKLGLVALRCTCGASRLAGIVTDWRANKQRIAEVEAEGIKVYTAEKPSIDL